MTRVCVKAVASLASIWVLLLATTAYAGDVKCMWDALTPATQDALIRVKSLNPLGNLQALSPSEARTIRQNCSIQKSEALAALKALSSYAVELAEQQKISQVVFRGPPVEVVWKELSSNDRAVFRQWISSLKGRQPSTEEFLANISIVFRPLGVPAGQEASAVAIPEYNDAAKYFIARAARENFEAQF